MDHTKLPDCLKDRICYPLLENEHKPGGEEGDKKYLFFVHILSWNTTHYKYNFQNKK